jgi:hypothetical protein
VASKSAGCSEFEPSDGKDVQQNDLKLSGPETATGTEVQPIELLADLCILLEEFAPAWYPEYLRHRILKALQLPTEVLLEVCALLVDHSPTWYTDRQRARVLSTLETLGLLERDTL